MAAEAGVFFALWVQKPLRIAAAIPAVFASRTR